MRYAQPNGSALQKILQPVRRGLEVIEFLWLPLSGKVSAPLGFSRSVVFETRPMREREMVRTLFLTAVEAYLPA